MNSLSVVIGRFQTPYVGLGHQTILEHALSAGKTLVLLGCSPNPGKRNPLSFEARARMIMDKYQGVSVLPIQDHPDNTQWVRNVDALIGMFRLPATIYSGPDGVADIYQANKGKYPVKVSLRTGHSTGTMIRAEIEQWHKDSSFRNGVVWAYEQAFIRIDPCVDVIIQGADAMVLLGQKSTDGGMWRFIGGYVDPNDSSYEMAAKREALEETGCEVGDLKYIGSASVDDWRYRGPEKIFSACFVAHYVFGSPRAADDIEQIKWFRIDEIREVLHPAHQPIYDLYKKANY